MGGANSGWFRGIGAILLAVVLCGSANALCTDTPYYPICTNTHLTYQVNMVNAAAWDSVKHELTVTEMGGPADVGAEFNERAVLASCAEFPLKQFYIWAYGYNSAPTMRTFLGDALWEQRGVEYIGEAWGRTQLLNKGEPLITVRPRVGEWIHTGGYARAKHCGAEMVPFPEFSTDYFTVAHYEEWNGYKDVLETSLIETNTAGGTEYLYTYFFVRGLGIVQIILWTGQSGYNWVLKSYRRTR